MKHKSKISTEPRKVIILGVTGSIGGQAMEVAAHRSSAFRIAGVSSYRGGVTFERIIREHRPGCVCIGAASEMSKLRKSASELGFRLYGGDDGLCDMICECPADTVVNAIVGMAGLRPALISLETGKNLVMANKESIVAAGDLLKRTAKANRVSIIPADSEHSAIFQCLQGRSAAEIAGITLTASGGPFLNRKNLRSVTPKQALAHPLWKMGPKVSIDSATMMNKGFEIIEASKLFDIAPDRISVVIHKECIIHSLVELTDGSMIAQLAAPDMRLPVAYAMNYPNRIQAPGVNALSLKEINSLTFEAPDERKYPCLELARLSMKIGGVAPAVLCAADEVAVGAFLKTEISFENIYRVLEGTLSSLDASLKADPGDIENITAADREARKKARNQIRKMRA
ncbi:MAG TPA: 1-deoxy-D-xylulose-5-phosphate reductoisomerase [bacterium]|nr:1-deoxy-D-xylulose-5-phosphate reductoisomerase [bacterium]